MKNTIFIVIGIVVIILILLGAKEFLMPAVDAAKDDGINGCVKVNRSKFSVGWNENKIPHGTIGRIAKSIFGSDAAEYGNKVGGFFKAIDVYPSDSAGKYYKTQIKKYYDSDIGLDYWNMSQGELMCLN